jgi:hypothetical protein
MPFGISSLVSGIFGVYGQQQQNRNIDKQIKAQAEENEKTRQYNLGLAKMQNQWNLDQWNRENAYNTPAAQMARLREGGLNPDLMYQNGTSGLTAASSPSMTAGAPATPQDMSALGMKQTVGDAMQSALSMEMQRAQIEATKAATEKTKSETKGIDITNMTLGQMNEAQLQQFRDQHKLSGEQYNNLIAVNDNLKKEGQQLDMNLKVSKLRYQNLPNEIFLENLSRAVNILFQDKQVQLAMSQLDINEKIFKEELPAKIALLQQQANTVDWPTAITSFFSGALGLQGNNLVTKMEDLGAKAAETVTNAINDAVEKANNMGLKGVFNRFKAKLQNTPPYDTRTPFRRWYDSKF